MGWKPQSIAGYTQTFWRGSLKTGECPVMLMGVEGYYESGVSWTRTQHNDVCLKASPSEQEPCRLSCSTQALVCTTHLKHRANYCTSHFRSLKKIHLNGFDSHPFRNSLIFTVLVLLSGYDWKRCLRMEVHPERNDSLSITHLPRENMNDGTWWTYFKSGARERGD